MIISGEISNGDIQPTSKGKEHGRPIASDEALPILPRAPTLAPNQQVDSTAISNNCAVNTETEIVRKALEVIPTGSMIVFAAEDIGVLFLAGAPIVRGTESYREVEDFARVCDCSLSLQDEAGTITFHRKWGFD